MQVQPLELLLEEEDEEDEEDEDEQIKYWESQLEVEGIESVIQQVGFPFKHEGDKVGSAQEGVPPFWQNMQPLDEELVEEVEEEPPEEEDEDDELLEEELEAQMKLELHMELSKPLLAQHRGVPPRKEQVVL